MINRVQRRKTARRMKDGNNQSSVTPSSKAASAIKGGGAIGEVDCGHRGVDPGEVASGQGEDACVCAAVACSLLLDLPEQSWREAAHNLQFIGIDRLVFIGWRFRDNS